MKANCEHNIEPRRQHKASVARDGLRGSRFCTYRRETTLEIYNTSINKYPQAKLSCTFSTQLISLAVKYILQQDMTFLFVSYVYRYVHSLPTQPPLIANFSTNILPVLSNQTSNQSLVHAAVIHW